MTMIGLLSILLLGGPASPAVPAWAAGPAAQEIVFHPPPDKPSIRYLKGIAGKRDLAGRKTGRWTKLWDFLTGKQTLDLPLARPYGLWVRGERIYVADTESSSVVVFDDAGGSVSRIGTGAQGRLTAPTGVAVDASSRVYVTDSASNLVKAFSPDGSLLWQVSSLGPEAGQLNRPTGIALGPRQGLQAPRQEVHVADTGNSRIVVLSADGAFLRQISRRGEGEGEVSVPTNVWVEPDGTVLVSDTILCRIQAFSPEGRFLFRFGECGDMAGYMARPRGVASDSEGNIYVVDALFDAVQVFDRSGKLLLFFGGHGAGPASFELPAGIFIDERDRIFVADSFNRRIQVFEYLQLK